MEIKVQKKLLKLSFSNGLSCEVSMPKWRTQLEMTKKIQEVKEDTALLFETYLQFFLDHGMTKEVSEELDLEVFQEIGQWMLGVKKNADLEKV